jgi:hypothetical protein
MATREHSTPAPSQPNCSITAVRILSNPANFSELKTDDAIERPLPSFKLLEMQWFLQRVIGMAGATGPYEDWLYQDPDEEISNPGLDMAI